MKITISPATESEAWYVATHLRDADRIEVSLSEPDMAVEHAVMDSMFASQRCEVVNVDNAPVLLYGLCASPSPDIGIPWMVSTEGINLISRQFLLGSVSCVQWMQDAYPVLYNQVHRRNAVSIKWLRWLGFDVIEKPTGICNEFYDFYRFRSRRG